MICGPLFILLLHASQVFNVGPPLLNNGYLIKLLNTGYLIKLLNTQRKNHILNKNMYLLQK